jgi:Tfp pilus assembly protein FimT
MPSCACGVAFAHGTEHDNGRAAEKSEAGFSVTEMVIVAGITAVLSGMAVLPVGMAQKSLRGDSGMRALMAQIVQGRENAITQRRNMRMIFDLGNHVEIKRENTIGVIPLISISSTLFGSRVQYVMLITTDTPDMFGNSDSSGVNLPTAVSPGPGQPPEVKFTPDGRLVNQNGATLNVTILVGLPNEPLSQRSVTVLGSTGRIRGYRWDGHAWKLV